MRQQMFWVAAVAALLSGCGNSGSVAKQEVEKPKASAPPLDTATFGSISGKVAFAGPKPEVKTLSMDATPSCARQHKGPIYSEEVVLNSNGTLKNVIVKIKD